MRGLLGWVAIAALTEDPSGAASLVQLLARRRQPSFAIHH